MTVIVDVWAPPEQSTAPRPAGAARPRRPAPPRRPQQPRRPLGDRRLVATVGVLVLLVLAAWSVVQAVALGALSQSRAQNVLHSQLREQLAGQTAPLGTVEPGDPVALMAIPTLGVEQVVVEGTASSDLQSGPGHRRDTPLPGQKGVSVLYGKALTWGAPFRSIATLVAGDGITVTTGQGEFVYRVSGVRRGGDPVPPTTEANRLTLASVDVKTLMPGDVVYVDAVLQGEPVVGEGRVSAVPDSEKALGTDASGLPLLAVALALLLGAVLAIVSLVGRLPAAVLWTLGTPVVVAALWLAGNQAGQLLPNLF